MRAVTLSSGPIARSFVSSVALIRSNGVPRSAEVLNNAIPLSRSGASIAILGATNPPQEVPRTTGVRTPVASRTWAPSVAGRVERERPPARFTQGGDLMTPHAVIGEQAGPEQRGGLVWLALVIDVHRAENRVYAWHGGFPFCF